MRPLILKITLAEIAPPVWRRVVVPSDILLSDLHEVIQVVMGWENDHLHDFRIRNTRYAPIDAHYDVAEKDGESAELGEALGRARTFEYVYDFGDDWRHLIEVQRVTDGEKFAKLPICIEGERECPPEDCGGPWGYQELLEAIADPKNERHEELLEWVGDEFDAEAFNVAATNAALVRFR